MRSRTQMTRRSTVLLVVSWLGLVASGVSRLAGGHRSREQQQCQPQSQPQSQLQAVRGAPAEQQSLFYSDRRKYFGLTAFAGAISCSVTHSMVLPLDVIKTALQTDESLAGPRHAAVSLLKSGKGIAPFFNGIRPTAIGYYLQGAAKFGGYEFIKRTVFDALQESGEFGAELAHKAKLPIMILSAATAELAASAVLCPLEVMKLRMQTSAELSALGLRNAMLQVVKGDGMRALYKGFTPICLRQGESCARHQHIAAAALTGSCRPAAPRQALGGQAALPPVFLPSLSPSSLFCSLASSLFCSLSALHRLQARQLRARVLGDYPHHCRTERGVGRAG